MSRDVDELFGRGAGQPTPQKRWVYGLLFSGLGMALIGMVCTAVPGGLVVLWAWAAMEKEVQRLESGYLPAEARSDVYAMQRLTYLGVVAIIALFIAQGALFVSGFYETLWEGMLVRLELIVPK
jgi:hypothetical protein